MKREQRHNDFFESLTLAQEAHQAELWTSLPGIIVRYDPATQTAAVQPAIQGVLTGPDGKESYKDLPLLADVPVEFPAGGGFTLTFPIRKGDECIVEFQSRCLDGWWKNGGVRPPLVGRMHDLSDAVCRVGVRSQPRRLAPNPDAANVQLRSDDGQAHVTLRPDYSISLHNPLAECNLGKDGAILLKNQAASLAMTPGGDITLENAGGTLAMTTAGQVAITAVAAISLTAPAIALNGALSANAGSGGASINSSGSISINAAEVSINEGC